MATEQEMKWWTSVDRGVMPGSSSSHQLHTLPGMLIAIREMAQFGREYAAQTVANAKALGQALTDEGVSVEAKEFGFTESHQLAINVTNFGIAKELARSLSDKNNIITNYNMLPGDKDAKNPTGLRIGVQEMTRYGMKEDEMGELADLMKAGLQGKIVKDEVIKLRSRFTDVHFALQSVYIRKFNQHNFTRVSVNLEWPWILLSVFSRQSENQAKILILDIFFSCVFRVFYCESIFSCAR